MPGTAIAYRPTLVSALCPGYALRGGGHYELESELSTHGRVSCYAPPMQCPRLAGVSCYAPEQCPVLNRGVHHYQGSAISLWSPGYHPSGHRAQVGGREERGSGCYLPTRPTHVLCDVRYRVRLTVRCYYQAGRHGGGLAMSLGISLRACYAMYGTDLAYGASSLRACYAMPGTDLAHGARLSPYTLSTRSPVLRLHMLLPGAAVKVLQEQCPVLPTRASLCPCYGKSDTDLARHVTTTRASVLLACGTTAREFRYLLRATPYVSATACPVLGYYAALHRQCAMAYPCYHGGVCSIYGTDLAPRAPDATPSAWPPAAAGTTATATT
eukprot:3933687-Rhodomonas_salina.2